MSAINKSAEFEKLYNKYYSVILRYVLKRISNITVAEDLTMDIFASCWKRYDSFDPNKATFATWLYTITNNRLKNYYRDNKLTEEIDELSAVDFGFEDEIIQAQYITALRHDLAEVLAELNETQQKIVVLKYFGNKTSKEIADELGLTPVNVRVQLSRTLKLLREKLSERRDDYTY